MVRKEVAYISEDETYVFECPHCECSVQVSRYQVNCHIFRHGIVKSTMLQIDPHLSKEECDRLKEEDLIHGCGKPFQLVREEGGIHAVTCGYI